MPQNRECASDITTAIECRPVAVIYPLPPFQASAFHDRALRRGPGSDAALERDLSRLKPNGMV
jgi:hypothetical protein